MRKWEYRIDYNPDNCNNLGFDGWELVNVLQTNIHYPDDLTFIYKRQEQDAKINRPSE